MTIYLYTFPFAFGSLGDKRRLMQQEKKFESSFVLFQTLLCNCNLMNPRMAMVRKWAERDRQTEHKERERQTQTQTQTERERERKYAGAAVAELQQKIRAEIHRQSLQVFIVSLPPGRGFGRRPDWAFAARVLLCKCSKKKRRKEKSTYLFHR